MLLLIQLVIGLFCSFIKAEYILYKYDRTELTEQEHRKAYQILLEQQWPTAPAFNSNYNPEIDEETEISKRLKAEVPTVYARWVPKIVYEFFMCKAQIDFTEEEKNDLIKHLENKDGYPTFFVSDDEIIKYGKNVNTLPLFIAIHKKANKYLQVTLNEFSLDNKQDDLTNYYKIIILKKLQEIIGVSDTDVITELNRIILKIMQLEIETKAKPNLFLIFRAGPFLPKRDFSLQLLQNLENDLSLIKVNKLPTIRLDHLHNSSYGLSLFAGMQLHPGSSCYFYYFTDDPTSGRLRTTDQYGYALPLKKTDILHERQFFGIPPLMTLINSFFCYGELFHARAFTLISDNLQARQDIEAGLETIMTERYGTHNKEYLAQIKDNKSWYDYWTKDPILSRFTFKLDNAKQVIKQAALRAQYIVQNAIPLNSQTEKIINSARAIFN